MKKINIIIYLILFIITITISYNCFFTNKTYLKTYEYLDSTIIIEISSKKEDYFSEIEKIIKKYDNYLNTTNKNSLYYINHNFEKEKYLTIDADLYNLVNYGIDVYNKSNQKIDISQGNLYDLWDSYIINKISIPTDEELKLTQTNNINDIILKDKKILNNKININLDYIIKGYVIDEIKNYLNNKNITDYIIRINNTILVGNKTKTIGLPDPDNKNNILKIIEKKNKAIVTTSCSDKYFDYKDNRYHNIIDLNTLKPANYVKSVTVIADDVKEAEIISKTLFMMPIEEGKKLIKAKKIQVIWYTLNNQIITN